MPWFTHNASSKAGGARLRVDGGDIGAKVQSSEDEDFQREDTMQTMDCSDEPFTPSSFAHTWSKVKKPRGYISTLRDLRGRHLPMLRKIRRDIYDFLKRSMNIDYQNPAEMVSIHCHYPSSARFSTLHFHVIFGQKFQEHAQKKHRPHQLSRQFSLDDIIEKLEHDGKHFKKATLRYFLGDKADLMDPVSNCE